MANAAATQVAYDIAPAGLLSIRRAFELGDKDVGTSSTYKVQTNELSVGYNNASAESDRQQAGRTYQRRWFAFDEEKNEIALAPEVLQKFDEIYMKGLSYSVLTFSDLSSDITDEEIVKTRYVSFALSKNEVDIRDENENRIATGPLFDIKVRDDEERLLQTYFATYFIEPKEIITPTQAPSYVEPTPTPPIVINTSSELNELLYGLPTQTSQGEPNTSFYNEEVNMYRQELLQSGDPYANISALIQSEFPYDTHLSQWTTPYESSPSYMEEVTFINEQ